MNPIDDVCVRWNKEALPNGLQVIALEYSLSDEMGPILGKTRGQALERDKGAWFSTLSECASLLGESHFARSNAETVFGVQPFWRLRLDVLATPEVIENVKARAEGTLNVLNAIGIRQFVPRDERKRRVQLAHAELFPNFAHHTVEYSNDVQSFEVPGLKEVWPEWFNSDADVFKTDEFARWAAEAQITAKEFEQLRAVVDACDGDAWSIAEAHSRATRCNSAPQSFLVPGLIPRGALTLLLGNKKVGKSAIALELLVAVTRRETEWLGFPLDTTVPGFAVYLFGEDSEGEVANRVALMSGGETSWLLRTIPDNGVDIDSVLAALTEKVAVLVVDPARKFFRGDEDGSDAVSDFFTKLETFAKAKNCAVIVLHHLKRNAAPRTLAEVATQYRGSSVFLDRPRVTLAVLRKRDETHFGIPAPDGVPLHNFLASSMFAGVRRLRRDEASFRHVNLDTRSATEPMSAAGVSAGDVFKVATRLIGAGTRVTRTGKSGLYELKPTELVGMPRVAVRAAVDALVAEGRLKDASGVLAIPAPLNHQAAVGDLA